MAAMGDGCAVRGRDERNGGRLRYLFVFSIRVDFCGKCRIEAKLGFIIYKRRNQRKFYLDTLSPPFLFFLANT